MADLWGWFTGATQKKKAEKDYQDSINTANAQAGADLNNQFGQLKAQADKSNQDLFSTMRDNQNQALAKASQTAMGSAGARGMAGGAGATVAALSSAADQSQKELNGQISNIGNETNTRLQNLLYGGQQKLSDEKRARQGALADGKYADSKQKASPWETALEVGKTAAKFFP